MARSPESLRPVLPHTHIIKESIPQKPALTPVENLPAPAEDDWEAMFDDVIIEDVHEESAPIKQDVLKTPPILRKDNVIFVSDFAKARMFISETKRTGQFQEVDAAIKAKAMSGDLDNCGGVNEQKNNISSIRDFIKPKSLGGSSGIGRGSFSFGGSSHKEGSHEHCKKCNEDLGDDGMCKRCAAA